MDTVSTATRVWTRETAVGEKRDVWGSIKRGFRGRCPRCGEGKLFRAFLKVDNNCSVCGLDFTPHRADDLPAYLVIVIVGHIVVPTALLVETNYSPPVWLQLAIYLPFTLVASLALLQPVKGAVVGIQWACACTDLTKTRRPIFRRSEPNQENAGNVGGGMTEAANVVHEQKEADHHPYFRPKDAATLILVDRSAATPKVLVGKRHDKVVFMPGKFVFPGGRVDKADNRVPVAAPISPDLEANLLKGSPKITPSPRARRWRSPRSARPARKPGFASAARAMAMRQRSKAHGSRSAKPACCPIPSGLFLIARAITPPGRVRRFDTRFFTADASAIAHRVEGVIHPDAELVELVWVEIGSKPLADLHPMTRNVLNELERRLATGPLKHDADVPFFHFYGGKMQKDVLGA